jgi:hypothetical protein
MILLAIILTVNDAIWTEHMPLPMMQFELIIVMIFDWEIGECFTIEAQGMANLC